MNDIIVAQATPEGSGALAIVRFSGTDIRSLLKNLVFLKSGKSLCEIKTHTVHYGEFCSAKGELIDQIIIYLMDAPRSFTGEDTIEIVFHNNQFIIKQAINECIEAGARMAKRGEFAQRAVINKKIDVVQAEAIRDLIHAQSSIATKVALCQVEGSLSSEIKILDDLLVEIAAWSQASFEFLEEERDFTEAIQKKIAFVKEKILTLLATYPFSKIFKEGVRIAFIGHVNAGKSSLLNSFLGYKRAIVNEAAGTTRDTIEAFFEINGYNTTLIDTAGVRETKNEIEKEGVGKSLSEMKTADIILLIYSEKELEKNSKTLDWYKNILQKYKEKIVIVKNKSDESCKKNIFENEISISAKKGIMFDKTINSLTKEGQEIKKLINHIGNYIHKKFDVSSMHYVVNLRQNECLEAAFKKVNEIEKLLSQKNVLYEIILLHVTEIQELLSDLSGKSIETRSFDKVFREFCVGK